MDSFGFPRDENIRCRMVSDSEREDSCILVSEIHGVHITATFIGYYCNYGIYLK